MAQSTARRRARRRQAADDDGTSTALTTTAACRRWQCKTDGEAAGEAGDGCRPLGPATGQRDQDFDLTQTDQRRQRSGEMLQVFSTAWPDDPRKSLIGTGACEKHALKYQKGVELAVAPLHQRCTGRLRGSHNCSSFEDSE